MCAGGAGYGHGHAYVDGLANGLGLVSRARSACQGPGMTSDSRTPGSSGSPMCFRHNGNVVHGFHPNMTRVRLPAGLAGS